MHGFDLGRLLAYKDALIEYLQRSIGEMVVTANQIAAQLCDLDPPPLDNAFTAVAGHELANAFAPTAEDRLAAEAISADGALHIRLEPIPGVPPATLVTDIGRFHGPDHLITITRLDRDEARLGTDHRIAAAGAVP